MRGVRANLTQPFPNAVDRLPRESDRARGVVDNVSGFVESAGETVAGATGTALKEFLMLIRGLSMGLLPALTALLKAKAGEPWLMLMKALSTRALPLRNC